jgi:hypothetical protein
MNITPEICTESCKQFDFISALIGGFSFEFIGTLLPGTINFCL